MRRSRSRRRSNANHGRALAPIEEDFARRSAPGPHHPLISDAIVVADLNFAFRRDHLFSQLVNNITSKKRAECPLMALSGHRLVRCICLLLTQSGHGLSPNEADFEAATMTCRGSSMKRREFITLLCGVAASPLAAHAQQRERVRRLGVLKRRKKRPQGKGPTFRIYAGPCSVGLDEWPKFADGNSLGRRRRRQPCAQLRQRVGRVATRRYPCARNSGNCCTSPGNATIPIVFVVVTDPVGDGFVAGLPRPGGNITGFLTS